MALSAPDIYSFAFFTESTREKPFARLAAIAEGTLTISGDVTDYAIDFSTKDGTFTGVGARTSNNKTNSVTLNMSKLGNNPTQFDDITIDFSR